MTITNTTSVARVLHYKVNGQRRSVRIPGQGSVILPDLTSEAQIIYNFYDLKIQHVIDALRRPIIPVFEEDSSIEYNPDALAFFNELPVEPTAGYKNIINDLILSLKSTGNYSKLDILQQFDSQYIENTGYSYVNPSQTRSEFISGGTFGIYDWVALEGGRTLNNAYINTHWNPSTDGVNYTINGGTYFIWSNTNENVANKVDIGAISGGNGILAFLRDGGFTFAAVNDSSSGVQLANVGSSEGLFSFVRISSTQFEFWYNGVLQGTYSRNSTSLVNLEVFLGALNNGGSPQFYSPKKYRCWGTGSKDIDQLALYNSLLANKNALAQLPYTPPSAPTDEILRLSIPSLIDSVNGWNSVLGDSLPGGFSAPSIDSSNNLVFNGAQTVKLNNSLTMGSFTQQSYFISFYCDTPEETQNIFQTSLTYVSGIRINSVDRSGSRWVNAGAVFVDEGPTTEPKWGLSLPKIQKGYNTIGVSWSNNTVIMFCNGLISYYETNPGSSPAATGGWIGGYPGTTNNNYTLDSFIKVLGGSNIHVFNRTLSAIEMLNLGENIMYDLDMSQIVFEGDSITQGATVDTNAHNWPAIVCSELIDNTSYKWSALNIGIGSRYLQTMAANCDDNNINVPYRASGSVNIDIIRPTRKANVKEIYVLLAGINDIANGRNLAQMQADFTTLINFRNYQGYNCFVLSVTSDVGLTAGQETLRLQYNTWLATQETSLGFTFINTCANPNLAGQPGGANAYFSDGVHYTTLTCSIIGPMVYNSIIAQL